MNTAQNASYRRANALLAVTNLKGNKMSDTERLDWVILRGATIAKVGESYRVEDAYGVLSDWYPTTREAIDNAMNTDKEHK